VFLKTNIQRENGMLGKEDEYKYMYKTTMAYLEHTSAIVQTIATWPIVGASDEVEWDMRGVLSRYRPLRDSERGLHLGSCIHLHGHVICCPYNDNVLND
jgi:hypothetical protein